MKNNYNNNNSMGIKARNTILDMFRRFLRKSDVPKMWAGTVTAYNAGTRMATIYLAGDSNTTTSDYINNTGQSLAANDLVYLMSRDRNLTNAFVAFKR